MTGRVDELMWVGWGTPTEWGALPEKAWCDDLVQNEPTL